MNLHVDARNLIVKNSSNTYVTVENASIRVETKEKERTQDTKSINLRNTSLIGRVTGKQTKKMSPQKIAKKIAQGKSVNKEELEFLKNNCPDIFRKAMNAKRIRETLESDLKAAKSDTAKATAVANATAMASMLATAEANAEGGQASSIGPELYSDAIQVALKKYGSKKLNDEMKDFLSVNQVESDDTLQEEEMENELEMTM